MHKHIICIESTDFHLLPSIHFVLIQEKEAKISDNLRKGSTFCVYTLIF